MKKLIFFVKAILIYFIINIIVVLIVAGVFLSYDPKKDGLLFYEEILKVADGKYQLVCDRHNDTSDYRLYEVGDTMSFGLINSITMYYLDSDMLYVVGQGCGRYEGYNYFALNIANDDIEKYISIDNMPNNLQAIFNDESNFVLLNY